MATGVDDPWDFGTNVQYPALKVDFDGNNDATWEEFGDQERSAPSPPPTITSDDDPALIDITTLEQLDAIRYDLDGDGWPSSAGETAWKAAFTSLSSATVDDDDGTRDPSSTYMGYELMESLDFDDESGSPSKWSANCSSGCLTATDTEDGTSATVGWLPIGDNTDSFNAVFEGNGHTISNLYINRTTTRLCRFVWRFRFWWRGS